MFRDTEKPVCEDASSAWASRAALGFRAGDTNLYRYVGNDPVNGLDPSGLAVKAAVLMSSGRSKRYNSDNSINIFAHHPSVYSLISSDEQARIDRRLAPHAILLAAEKAIGSLGIKEVELTVGDDLKAKITNAEFQKLQKQLGEKLSEKKTVSGDKAWGARLDDTWELKIYQKGNVFSIAVGHHTQSIEHYMDALAYKLKGSTIGNSGGGTATISTFPNGQNAERYLGKPVYDYNTAYELHMLLSQGHITEDQYLSIVGNGIYVGNLNAALNPAFAESQMKKYRAHCRELRIPGFKD